MSVQTPPKTSSAPGAPVRSSSTPPQPSAKTVMVTSAQNGFSESSKCKPDGVPTPGAGATAPPAVLHQEAVDPRLAERRRSLVPMSSMEEENYRERLHIAQLRKCSNIVSQEARYTRDTFKRLFQSKAFDGVLVKYTDLIAPLKQHCIKESNVQVDLPDKLLYEGLYVEDRKLMCYLRCLYLKLGMLNEAGEIHEANVKKNVGVPDEYVKTKVYKNCKNVQGADLCEKAFRLSQCTYQTVKNTVNSKQKVEKKADHTVPSSRQ